MQTVRSFLVPPRGWWLVGTLGVLVLVGTVLLLQTCEAQPPQGARAARTAPAPAAVVPVLPPTLTWNYPQQAPETFLVRRQLNNAGPWQEVVALPGATGTTLTWSDHTLPPSAVPFVAQYLVYAVTGPAESETSNRAIATFGGAPRRTMVTVVGVDSEETTDANNRAVRAADDKPVTFWHTKYSGTSAPLPHWITLDVGAVLAVDGLAYLPRQDGVRNGTVAQFEVLTSLDNKAWSQPVAQGTWLWGPNALEQYVRWPAVEARYVRLRALSEVSGGPWTSAAEIGVYAASPRPGPGECVMEQPTPQTVVTLCVLP